MHESEGVPLSGDHAKTGAHLLLQVRVETLNEDLRDAFCQWYPGIALTKEDPPQAA
jgi:hypothetical protein